ncbi:MAG: hypothetical protein M1834_000173 [Cirrosporium novae-zelandiae]|nr:MAG: hypothetical protein M1834_000173 [Cirrosporium novae-zelandiae]
MSTPYTCRNCQRLLLDRGRSSFLALSSIFINTTTKSQQSRKNGSLSTPGKRIDTRRGRIRESHDHTLESLFKSSTLSLPIIPGIPRGAYTRKAQRQNRITRSKRAVVHRYSLHDISKWKETFHDPSSKIENAWAAILEYLAKKEKCDLNSTLDAVVRQREDEFIWPLLKKLIKEWAIGSLPEHLPAIPTPAIAMRELYSIDPDLVSIRHWNFLLVSMAAAVAKKEIRKGHSKDPEGCLAALDDLLQAWDLFLDTFSLAIDVDVLTQTNITVDDTEAGVPSGPNSTEMHDLEYAKVYSYWRQFPSRLLFANDKFAQNNSSLQFQSIPRAAFYVNDLMASFLCTRCEADFPAYTGSKAFWISILNTTKPESLETCQHDMKAAAFPPRISRRVRRRWNFITLNDHTLGKSKKSKYSGNDAIAHELLRAHNVDRIDKLWQCLSIRLKPKPSDNGASPRPAEGNSMEELFCLFTKKYIAFHHLEKASAVYELMVSTGFQPSESYITAIVEGSVLAKDVGFQEALWKRMEEAGVNFTEAMWIQRLKGLLRDTTYHQKGIDLLSKFITSYETVSSNCNTNPTTPKPTTEIFHFAVTQFLRAGYEDEAWKVFQWAERTGNVKVELINALLTHMSRNHKADRMQALLEKLNALGLKPDVATFTIMLQHILRNHNIDPNEQFSRVVEILRQMDEQNIKPNVHSYGVIIYQFLRRSINMDIINMILNRMAAQNISPSAHIYTTLLDHLFSRNPPDLAGVDALWQQVNKHDRPVDHVFYDRLVEGYGRIGEVSKMMYFFRTMHQRGETSGWIARTQVLEALTTAREWDILSEIIKDAKEKKAAFKSEPKAKKGRDRFWDLVRELDV